ncbi:MAG: PRC-barrel domain-containing protein [Methanosphaera sp.]|uniref:PRC-barrel domain-containing protein n=1 Tax=Methanosphaera sp. ISO3-F5 TaxID=1452353 RepID=UPI002B261A1A|nr:PRC-barrel domain-containing protein [Methanosphaera sp. ISO3-F5]MBR0472411.1 PRC-barrel domain-containing protein [Methanosphaera sp.]WQH63204.1 PRC-barrel domain-containing protein [Methanosphaera sp. ISO3-F5]
MKITKIIGKKVLDSKANEIGKIHDIDLDLKSNNINNIFINSGELSLRKVMYEISPENIAQIGDYMLLNISKSELSTDNKDEKKKEVLDVEIVNPEDLEEK